MLFKGRETICADEGAKRTAFGDGGGDGVEGATFLGLTSTTTGVTPWEPFDVLEGMVAVLSLWTLLSKMGRGSESRR